MLVVDEDQFVADFGVGQADTARPRPVGDPPDGTMCGKLGIGQREKVLELARLQAPNTKIHESPPSIGLRGMMASPKVSSHPISAPIFAAKNRLSACVRGFG